MLASDELDFIEVQIYKIVIQNALHMHGLKSRDFFEEKYDSFAPMNTE